MSNKIDNINIKPSLKISNNIKIEICEGDSILLAGKYQKLSGIYYDTLVTSNDCDSIITTTLVVKPIILDNKTTDRNVSNIDWKKPIRFNSTLYVDKK
jgi:hypothetical protein